MATTKKKPFPKVVVSSFLQALDLAEKLAGGRPEMEAPREAKKNYAEYFSRGLATWVASGLRPGFKGILPTRKGEKHESPARSAKGVKKLDVNYSTLQLGLGLGVSIKTINFRDPSTKRYTKNYTRVDNELRAEAMDYHKRQPYSVMVAVVFLPSDACEESVKPPDQEKNWSSFAQAVRIFRRRSGRDEPDADPDLFEIVFVAIYDFEGEDRGRVEFFDVRNPPPRFKRPKPENLVSFDRFVSRITEFYEERNQPRWVWEE
jgi:hypothetical protein